VVREAKDFIKSQIQKGALTEAEFKDKYSAFNKLKEMLKNSSGYVGFFTRAHYRDPYNVTIERLQKLYDNLKTLRKYNDAVDISQFTKWPYAKFEEYIQQQVGIKLNENLPGLVVNDSLLFVDLHRKINNYQWVAVICVRQDSKGKYVPDLNALRSWGSPKWCIKRDNYFTGSYVRTPDYLQYVIVEKDFFEQVRQEALKAEKSELKLVAHNYGTNWDAADSYPHHSMNTRSKRFGITTKFSENLSFFNQKDNVQCFDDYNNSVGSLEKFASHTNNFPIRLIDIEVRKVLGLKRSEYDVSLPTFEEIIDHIGINENVEEPDQIATGCGKFVSIMDRLYSKQEDFNTIRSQITPFFENTNRKNLIYTMFYALLYSDKISESILKMAHDMYSTKEKARDVNMVVTISLIQIYLDNKQKGIEMDENLVEIIRESVIKNFVLWHLTQSLIKDRPKSTIDLKRAMINVYKKNEIYNEIDGPGAQVTRSKLFKLISNYLYLHDREYGQKLMEDQGWEDEIEFIKQVLAKKQRKDRSNTDFLEKVANSLLTNMPKLLVEKQENELIEATYSDIFNEINIYKDEDLDYKYSNHVEALFTALAYYVNSIDPSITRKFKD
jgi:hypothetical protein